MKVMLCEDADWLLSEEAFSIYASCMYHPTYKDYKGQMDDLLCDPSTKVFVYEDQGQENRYDNPEVFRCCRGNHWNSRIC